MKQEVTIASQGKGKRAKKAPNQSLNTTIPIVVQSGNQSWWQGLTEKQRKVISTTAIVLGVSVVSAVAIYFGVQLVRKGIAKNEESKSFGKDKSATWAKQFKNAFDNNGWWGTNEELVRSTLIEVPSQEAFHKVKNAYGRLYKGESLIKTLTSELKDTEYNEMLAIITAKPLKEKDVSSLQVIYNPMGWAIRINSAVNYEWLGFGWGTDEQAITAVINEIPTQKVFFKTMLVYKEKYGTKLLADLKGDLDSSTYLNYQKMILRKPKQ